MTKDISISLDTHLENFVNDAIVNGRFENVNEMVCAGLRLLEFQRNRDKLLRAKLLEGKNSGIVENFDPKTHLKRLHEKYLDENGKLKKPTNR